MAGEVRTSPHRAAVGTGKNTPCQHQKGFYKCPSDGQNNQAIEESAKLEMGRAIKHNQPGQRQNN